MKRLIYKFLGGIIFISIVLLMVASFAHKEGEAEYEIIVDELVPLAGAIPIEDENMAIGEPPLWPAQASPMENKNPDEVLSIQVAASMLFNQYGTGTTDNEIEYGFLHGWFPWEILEQPLTDNIPCGDFYSAAFKAAGIQVWDACLYDKNNEASCVEQNLMAAKCFGLCADNAQASSPISFGDAEQTLKALAENIYEMAPPSILNGLKIDNAGKKNFDYLRDLQYIPSSIRALFNMKGWTISFNTGPIIEYAAELETSIVGLTDYKNKTIYLGASDVLAHELGHFYDYCSGLSNKYNYLFEEEKEATIPVIGRYAGANNVEFFAEYLSYYWRNTGDSEAMNKLKQAAPKTYAVIESLEADNWASP